MNGPAAARGGRLAFLGIDPRVVAGLALVAVAFAGGLILWEQLRVTEPVLVAARSLPAGHVLAAGDLAVTQARLEGALGSLAIGEGELGAVVGRTLARPLPAGALIVRPDLGSGPAIGPDEVGITVAVAADAVFASLRPGDRVALLATSEPGRPQSRTVTLLERVTVYEVARDPARVAIGGGQEGGARISNVTLLVPRAEAEQVTHALVNGRLTLVLVTPEPAEGSP